VIQAEKLSMSYGSVRALTDATFEVRRGEVLGLLGPNGAGKTTTLRILTTAMSPTSGRVLVDGVDAAADPIAVRRRIGYLPETAPLYVDMPVGDYLAFVGSARGLKGARLRQRQDDVVANCGLESVFYRPIAHLSKGFRQRTGLAGALIHDPDVLVLDEPTSGLDPIQILGIRGLIRSLARSKTILFSTHILQEIQAVSDRVMIMNEGRIVASGEPGELERAAMATDRLRVEAQGPAAGIERALREVPGVVSVESARPAEGGAAFTLRHAFGEASVTAGVSDALHRGGWPVLRLAHDRYSLEDVFIALVRSRQPLAADAAADAAAAAQSSAGGGEA
jgi:ABC-2 type transport system ATP-binding protein